MKYILLSLIIAAGSCCRLCNGQNINNPPIEYRLVAVNATDLQIESVSNEIKLYLPAKLHLPTAFTPNGDGLNDTFGPVGEGIEGYKITVFNRWGEVIFSSRSVNEKWDGHHKGSPVPIGVYNYEVLAYGKEFGEIHKAGHVTVVN